MRGKLDPKPGQMVLAQPGPRGLRVSRQLGSPKRARDVIDALLWERLERRGFARRVEDEALDRALRALAPEL